MGLVDDFGLNGYLPDRSAPYYCQDYVPIKNIYGDLIQTKDNRYIRIMEVLPVNLQSKSAIEIDDIAHEFKSWLSICPVNIQIKIVTGNSDPRKIIERIQERYSKEHDENVSSLMMHYTDLLNRLGSGHALSKKFYIIISYEPKASSKKNPTLDDISAEMNNTIQTMASYFARMGNIITPLSDSGKPEDEQWAIMDLLYHIYNPRSSIDEPGKPKLTIENRIARLFEDKKKITGDPNAMIGIDSAVAPLSIDLTKPDAVVIDGLYHTYLLVASDGYPSRAQAGWFNSYFSFGAGDTVDLFIHKEDKSRFVRDIGQKIKMTGIKMQDKTKAQADYEQTENAYYAANYIKDAINNNGEDPFYITTLITLTDYSYEAIKRRKEEVIDYFRSRNLSILPLKNIQEESMRSSFPFLNLSMKLYQKGKRNILSSGLSACYPFSAADMNDEGGILMGTDMISNSMCILNPFNQKAYKNANMVILGTSGSGKTYTEQLMALRMRTMGTQCFILAPDKAHEFYRACALGVKGEFIKIASSSKDHINIMDIRPTSSEVQDILTGDASDNMIYVSEKANTVITFISLLIPDLTNEEEQMIDTAVMNTYKRYGITEDNNSIYVDPLDESQGIKPMPILGDLYVELENINIPDRILKILSQFTTGSAKAFNNRTNVNLSNKYIVFDLSGLKGRMLPAGMYLALDFIVGRIREDVTERKFVFIDEGWQLIGSGGNEKAAEYVKWLFKIVRGYNGGACIATQDIDDFFSLNNGEYGGAILANSQIKMLLNMQPREAEYVQQQLKLTRAEIRDIKDFKRGECLVCANTNHIAMRIIGSEYETDLITTNPDDVKRVIEKLKNNELK